MRTLRSSLVLSVFALLLVPCVASAADMLDQQQTDTPNGSTFAGPGFGNSNSLAQTFTAGLTGALDHVGVYLRNLNATLPVKVEIRTVEASGAPSATVLASETIPAASIPPEGAFESVAFTPSPMVVAGTQYAIVVYTVEPFAQLEWQGIDANVYPGGAVWSSTPPPTTWNQGVDNFFAGVDLAFKTYVAVPECSMASGHGSVGKQGEPGHLSVIDSLSTNLAEPQKLQVEVERNSPRYHLVSLQQASCTGAAGERVFHGMGTAVRNTKKGYTLSFSIKEEAGGFFFESKVMKGAEEIEVNGGPLKTKTQKIS